MLKLDIYEAENWPKLEPVWSRLVSSCADASFFLSSSWVNTWIGVFGALLKPKILVFSDGGQEVGAAILVHKVEPRGPFRIRRIYLNAAGEEERDDTCIEFNSLLALPTHRSEVYSVLAGYLADQPWDEFVVNGCSSVDTAREFSASLAAAKACHTIRPSPYVDLAALRQDGRPYEELLRQPTRKHLRQNLRYYAGKGEIRVETPDHCDAAIAALDTLRQLHQQSWSARGIAGAFASERFVEFHRRLIRETFAQGNIRIFSIVAGRELIGVLYHFLYRGKLYFYQSGLNYPADKRWSPGLVCCATAIQYALGQDLGEYDFLAGDSQYKKSLATHCRELDWLVLQRPSLKIALIDNLRKVKKALRSRPAKASRSAAASGAED